METFIGSKMNKERLTLSLFTNVVGANKFKTVLIGKYKNPRPMEDFQQGDVI